MNERRAQGRPARGSDEVGREKIVDAMRDVMRIYWRGSISRKDLATFTGITPALVSYYFPKRPTLIAAATVPIVEAYESEMKEIAASDEPSDSRLFSLILLLVDCYGKDGGIIESFGEFVNSPDTIGGIPDYSAALQAHSLEIVKAWLAAHPTCHWKPQFVQSIIWGACKAVAPKAEHLAYRAGPVMDDAGCADAAAKIMQMLTSGLLAASSPVQHVAKRHMRHRAKSRTRDGDFTGSCTRFAPARHSDGEEYRH